MAEMDVRAESAVLTHSLANFARNENTTHKVLENVVQARNHRQRRKSADDFLMRLAEAEKQNPWHVVEDTRGSTLSHVDLEEDSSKSIAEQARANRPPRSGATGNSSCPPPSSPHTLPKHSPHPIPHPPTPHPSSWTCARQLRDILSKNAVRVIDLFREWDEDGDGTVSKKEFRKAMPLLGLDVPKKEIDALFDEWDPDGSRRLWTRGGRLAAGPAALGHRTRHAIVGGGLRAPSLLQAAAGSPG